MLRSADPENPELDKESPNNKAVFLNLHSIPCCLDILGPSFQSELLQQMLHIIPLAGCKMGVEAACQTLRRIVCDAQQKTLARVM